MIHALRLQQQNPIDIVILLPKKDKMYLRINIPA